ncbi:argininosuccinate synthase [Candidatus Palauibacter sp.]|uniref:argininosuccinate synthase n=1 Tax=Candidatus Palauibacter sp. TaxID=3101350 RepID=UPI003B5AF045
MNNSTTKDVKRVALAYSGGLDTSVMVTWLKENYGCEVVAAVVDVGQREDFDEIRDKALATGAVACRVVDLRERFLTECAFPALKAGAVYEGRYLLGTSLARPVIAAAQVEVAREFDCDAVAHGCTGKGNDQVRFELAYQALAPDLTVIAPWREWEITSREDAFAYAAERDIPVPGSPRKLYSIDRNLWHTSFEGGILEDPTAATPDELRELTVDPAEAPDTPADVVISFERGVPIALDGEVLDPVTLVQRLNETAGAHGVGRVDLVENRLVGMKSRGVYETPAGTVLLAALADLEALTLDRDTSGFKRGISDRYGELVYQGLWFSPLRAAFDAFLDEAHAMSTGDVTVRLFKGSAMPVARTSRYSLYREDLATFEEDSVYDQADAGGFVRLWGLPSSLAARVRARAASGDRDWAASASVETVRSSAKPMQRRGRAVASGSR